LQPDYKESSIYLDKYRQCLSRALSLVRSFAQEQWTRADADVKARAATETDAFTLYYGLFAAGARAPQVRQLMGVVESRRRTAQE
jgi:hypothetical protein